MTNSGVTVCPKPVRLNEPPTTVHEVNDQRYMAQALRLAERGLNTTDPNPRVGCVLVKANRIIGSGWHQRAGGPHAEILALSSTSETVAGSTCYVSLEPCCHHGKTGPCTQALIDAGVKRVVVACYDPNPLVAGRGLALLAAAGIETTVGVLADEAQAINPGFYKRFTVGLPYVRLKLGLSLDGRSAMASGESQWITGPSSRQDVQRWRARSSAILTGIDTVVADNPRLNVRATSAMPEPSRQPVRVILDSRLRTPRSAQILTLPGPTWIFTTRNEPSSDWPAGVEIVPVNASEARIDLTTMLQELARREINEVWVEAGATLSGALLQTKLVDELVLYFAPTLLGHEAKSALHLAHLVKLSDRIGLRFSEVRHIGSDLRIIAKPSQEDPECLPV